MNLMAEFPRGPKPLALVESLAELMLSRPCLFGGTGLGGKWETLMKAWRRESVLDVYNLLLAALLFASPWLFKLTNGTARMDFWIGGAAIAAISIGAIIAFANWEEWTNLALGAWLIASPWLLGFAHARATHFSVAIGAAVAYLALIELWLQYDAAHFPPSVQDGIPGHSPQS